MGRDLQGRVTVVTGSGRSIGLGIAKELSEKGASIVISDVNEDNARSGVAGIETMGGKATYILVDASKYGDTWNLVDATIKGMGGLDILVNSTGISRDGMLHRMSVGGWNTTTAVNLTGVFNCVRATANYMRERECGRIINISSASYLNGNIDQANYATAKTRVVALTKTYTKENGEKNITCNAIVPGFIDTEVTRGVPEKVWDIMVGKIFMGRAGTPEDVGNMVAFLASDKASYIVRGIFEMGGGMVL